MFRWDSLRSPAADLLEEPVMAGVPVSPEPRRAPGRGAWGHAPLTGAQVRYLVVTPTRIVVFTLDRDVPGPYLYRLLRVETEAPRQRLTGLEVRTSALTRRLRFAFDDGRTWVLCVTRWRSSPWRGVVSELGPTNGDDGH